MRAPSLPAGRRPSLVCPIETNGSVITCDSRSSHTPLLTATAVYDDMDDRASSSPLRVDLLRKPNSYVRILFFSFLVPAARPSQHTVYRIPYMTIVRGHTADLFLDRATADARNGRINVRYVKAIGCNFIPGRDENTNAQVSVSTACCACIQVISQYLRLRR